MMYALRISARFPFLQGSEVLLGALPTPVGLLEELSLVEGRLP